MVIKKTCPIESCGIVLIIALSRGAGAIKKIDAIAITINIVTKINQRKPVLVFAFMIFLLLNEVLFKTVKDKPFSFSFQAFLLPR